MALHFGPEEFAERRRRFLSELASRGLDGMLLFAQESMYWLTGYDTFGFCFFQCLVVAADGRMALLTRSADLRQAQHTSNVGDVRVWRDEAGASPAAQLRELVSDLGMRGGRLGIETDTQGLSFANGHAVFDAFDGFALLCEQSALVPGLRAVKSPAEIAYVRRAAELADVALEAGLALIRPGADEGEILAGMQGAVFRGGGDYPANAFIIGSGRDALLCRYKSGRRRLDAADQITLEFAGVYRHYHAALMRTVIVGTPTARHRELHAAAHEALAAVEAAMHPGASFGSIYKVHADVLDRSGLRKHRLNACGYSLGARFAPSWMDPPMFYEGNPALVMPGMVLFAHMILMDSDSGAAMTLGRTCLIGDEGPEPLSRASLDLATREG